MDHNKIKKARKGKEYTQIETARLVGVSVATYRLWEQGGGGPSAENKQRLIDILGLGGADHGSSEEDNRTR